MTLYMGYTREFLLDMATDEMLSDTTRLAASEELIKRMREDRVLSLCPHRRTLATTPKSMLNNLAKSPFYKDWVSHFLTWLPNDAVPPTIRSVLVDFSKGMSCVQCKEFNDYAEPNQPDGQTHVCYSCRESYKWKYGERHNGGRKAG